MCCVSWCVSRFGAVLDIQTIKQSNNQAHNTQRTTQQRTQQTTNNNKQRATINEQETTTPCHAVPRDSVLWHSIAVHCSLVLSGAVLCCPVLCAVLYYALLISALLCLVMLCCDMIRCAMLRSVVSCRSVRCRARFATPVARPLACGNMCLPFACLWAVCVTDVSNSGCQIGALSGAPSSCLVALARQHPRS